MKPSLQLLQDEKLLYDCAPQKNLVWYLMLARPIHLFKLVILLLVVLAFIIGKNKTDVMLDISQISDIYKYATIIF